MWLALRDRRLGGAKFRRQVPIASYIVDFLCADVRLIVEIDGGQHGGTADEARDTFLVGQGYRVLRFWNNEILGNMVGVLERLTAALGSKPSPAGGRGLGEGGSRKPKLPAGDSHPHPGPLPPAGEGEGM